MNAATERGKAFIRETRTKMEQLVLDFADGKLNREQFHVLYDRYQTQINGVQALLAEEDASHWSDILDGEHTIDIRSRLMAKAVGMLIYVNETSILLDQLGQVMIDPLVVSDLFERLAKNAVNSTDEYPQIVIEIGGMGWALAMQGDLTTIIVVFSKEPTAQQKSAITRLLHDFERANALILQRPNITPDQLAMPFQVIIRRAGRF